MGLLDFIFGKKKEARTSMSQSAAKPQTTTSRQTTSASSAPKPAELSIAPFVFESNQHQRYENGNPVKGLQECPRTVKVEKNVNGCSGYQLKNGDGYIVRMINGDTGQPQMSAKPMRVIKSTATEVTLRGYMVSAQTPFGFQDVDMADYGLTVSLKDGKVVKCVLHMYDRNVDIEYRKVALKPQQQDQKSMSIPSIKSIADGCNFELKFQVTTIQKVCYNGQQSEVLKSVCSGIGDCTTLKCNDGIVTVNFQDAAKMRQMGILTETVVLKPFEEGSITYQRDGDGDEFATREFNAFHRFITYYQVTKQHGNIVALVIMNPPAEPNAYYLAIMQQPI